MEYECTCGEILNIPSSLYGQEVECTSCGRVFRARSPRGMQRVGRAFRQGVSDIDRGIKRGLGGRDGAPGDELTGGEAILIFVANLLFFCLPGLICYFLWRDTRPGRASLVVTLTWIAFAIHVFFWLIGRSLFFHHH